MKGRYTKTVIKFQRPIWDLGPVLMYNEDHSIMGQLPLDKTFEMLFGDRYKIYCECKFRNSDGYLKIGREIKADF